MPYLVSSIIAIVTALIILMTRYEADDSQITAEIERAKSMFLTIDGFVNTYIQSGGDLSSGTPTNEKLNFATLYKDGILLGNIKDENIVSALNTAFSITNLKTLNSKDDFFPAKLQFPKSNIIWQVVPITISDSTINGKNYSSSAGAGYKLLVDFSKENSLMSKDAFSENFFGKEICEKNLFGTFINNAISISSTDLTFTTTGANNDGKFACLVFK